MLTTEAANIAVHVLSWPEAFQNVGFSVCGVVALVAALIFFYKLAIY